MRFIIASLLLLIAAQEKPASNSAKSAQSKETKKATPEHEPSDLEKWTGEWVITKAQYQGKDVPKDSGGPTAFTVADGKITFFAKGKALPTMSALQIKLDETKRPKQIDFISKEKGQLPCCYQFSDEKLQFALPMSMPGRVPPMKRPPSVTGEGEFITFEAKKKPRSKDRP